MTFPRYEGLDALRVFSSFGVVFLHVYVSAGYPSSLDLIVKFRDFALPVLLMSSFFVLTVSLRRKPDTGFGSFFSRRLKRLWLPLIIWTTIYSLMAAFVVPVLFGLESFGKLPFPVVFLTGYQHLWYLQFLFVGSLVCYPLIYRLVGERKPSPVKSFCFCGAAAILYGFLFWSFLRNYTDWNSFSAETDVSLKIFVSQAGNYILYIPVAVGIGLMSDQINALFARTAFRLASLVAVLITMIIYLGTSGIPFTREAYGVAVFLAALQPWKKIPFNAWQALASYSYGIYILHFLPAQMLWLFIARNNLELGGAAVFGIAIIIYFASFASAVVIRKLIPADWFLPLVRMSGEKRQRRAPADKMPRAAKPARVSGFKLSENA